MASKNKSKTINACPCGGVNYSECCGPLHQGLARASTAEQLMRSRYSAYALGLEGYVNQTWHSSTRPESLNLELERTQGKWIGLKVMDHHEQCDQGEVEFVARYKPLQGPATRLHERSRFAREAGQWWYVDGTLFDT
ncbi:YchJ family protein [Limnobacter sp.]|uniref:YchJ family protein n=1 Tax=Limnobacter sp. TaxID=2003368 RepID=UPI003518EA8F